MKGNVIQMNTLHLNSVRLNGIGKVQSASLKGGSTEEPIYPPVEPPVEPTPTYTLSASVTNGKVSATLNGSAVNLPFTANEGDVVVVEVTPNDGYTFEGWNDGNTDNPRTITMTADVVLSAECVEVVQPPVGNYIQFEDKAVEAICVANWSSDGIGLTEEDAAAVTTIGTTFKGNTEITSFDELRYFTGVTEIKANAFKSCTALASINLDNINNIGIEAFYASGVKELNAPMLSTLGRDAFMNSKLERIVSLGSITAFPSALSGNFGLFRNCPLKEVALSETLEAISSNSFTGVTSVNTMNLPSSLKTISSLPKGMWADGMTISLPNLTIVGQVFIGLGVKRVENLGNITTLSATSGDVESNGAFRNCSQLEFVRVPATITRIGVSTFYKCSALLAIVCEAVAPPTLDSYALRNTNNCPIYVPDASLEAYRTATNWNSFADRIHPLSEIERIVITQNNATDADFFVMRTSDNKTRKYKQFNVSQASSYSMSMSVASGSPIKGCLHIKRSGGWADNEVDSGWITGGMSKVVTDDMDADRSCPIIGVGFTYVSNNDGVPTMEEIRQYITFQIEIF